MTLSTEPAAVARQLGSGDTYIVTPAVDHDPRTLRHFAGLDPDLVSAAPRDKAGAENRVVTLTNEIHELRDQIVRLRADRAARRAELHHLGATPHGLTVRAARRLVRLTSRSAIQAR